MPTAQIPDRAQQLTPSRVLHDKRVGACLQLLANVIGVDDHQKDPYVRRFLLDARDNAQRVRAHCLAVHEDQMGPHLLQLADHLLAVGGISHDLYVIVGLEDASQPIDGDGIVVDY